MFYEASLLTKTGPLARVWLAANLDRKLTKTQVLHSNLDTNVKDIIGDAQAPMSLRLTGQLLLGVCKIYNKKAKYLMDDCSDALHKIKMVRLTLRRVKLPYANMYVGFPAWQCGSA